MVSGSTALQRLTRLEFISFQMFARPQNTGSIHVEIALQNALLERVGLLGSGSGCLSRWCRHVGDRLGSVVGARRRAGAGAGDTRTRRRASETRSEGEGGARAAMGHGAFGTRPKLLRPIEALFVTGTGSSTDTAHGLVGTEAHATGEGSSRGSACDVIIVDGALVNRIRIGGHASPPHEGGRCRGGSTRQTEGGDGESSALVVQSSSRQRARENGNSILCLRDGVASEEARESRRADGPAPLLTCHVVGIGGGCVVGVGGVV